MDANEEMMMKMSIKSTKSPTIGIIVIFLLSIPAISSFTTSDPIHCKELVNSTVKPVNKYVQFYDNSTNRTLNSTYYPKVTSLTASAYYKSLSSSFVNGVFVPYSKRQIKVNNSVLQKQMQSLKSKVVPMGNKTVGSIKPTVSVHVKVPKVENKSVVRVSLVEKERIVPKRGLYLNGTWQGDYWNNTVYLKEANTTNLQSYKPLKTRKVMFK